MYHYTGIVELGFLRSAPTVIANHWRHSEEGSFNGGY